MRRNILGKTGFEISSVAFGGIINMNETQADADHYVATAIDAGINYFDVAPSYGDAEQRLGPALKTYRKGVYLACKTGKRDAAGAKHELLSSLKRLETDHFDVYQLHAMTTHTDAEQVFAPGGAMETMVQAKKEGLIRNIGFSTHSEAVALKIMDMFAYDTVLFPMNWAMGINVSWGDTISDLAAKQGCGLLAMKALVSGLWPEDGEHIYPKSWCQPIYDNDALAVAAMKYAITKGAHTLIPPGNFEHFSFMLDHIDEAQTPLTDVEWALLKSEATKVKTRMIFS